MTGLSELQARFQAGILAVDDDTALDLINDGSREPAATLFGIYRYAYAARLVEVLQANFDVTWTLLGDEGFDEAARAYIAETPSRFQNARWYGDRFAEFLKTYMTGMPAVADIAALDWAIASAFDSADQPALTPEAMAVFQPSDWPDLVFLPHNSLQFVTVSTAAAEIYEALSAGEPPGSMLPTEINTVLVWRDQHTVRYRRLDTDESSLLANMIVGCKFSYLCEIAADVVGSECAGMKVAGFLRLWLQSGMIISVSAT